MHVHITYMLFSSLLIWGLSIFLHYYKHSIYSLGGGGGLFTK